MGAGRVLARAIDELRAMEENAAERVLALPILIRLRLEIPAEPMNRTQDDEEFAMSTQDIVDTFIQQQRNEGRREGRDEGRREGIDEGRREGIDEGRREGFAEAVLALFAQRFGPPPAEITAKVTATDDKPTLLSWLTLVATGSAEDILSAIRAHSVS